MTRKETLNNAKQIYQTQLSTLLNNREEWQKFLDFSSEFYKYSFMENLLMFAQKPTVTMCATMEQWNSVGRRVNRGAKALRILNNQNDEITLKYVFDIKDTNGSASVFSRRWKASEQNVVDILKDYFNYDNLNEFKSIMFAVVADRIDNQSLLGNMSDEELDNILKPEFIECLINSVTYQVAKRTNIKIDDLDNMLESYEKLENIEAIKALGFCTNKCSNDVLRILEYKIRQNRMEENYGETRSIWSESEKEYGGNVSTTISRLSNGRNSNGEISREGTGNQTTSRIDRETVEGEKSNATNRRVHSSSKIQQNDRGNDRGTNKTNNNGENLEGVEKSSPFNLPQKESNQLNLFEVDFTNLKEKIANEETIYSNDEVIFTDNNENSKTLGIESNDEITEYKKNTDNIEKNNYKIPDDNEKVYNLKEKYKENIEAIKLLKQLQQENKIATPEQQKILAKYNGWGGLSKCFEKNSKEWQEEYKELKEILTEDEYLKAKDTVLNAFYTDNLIIDSI